MSAASPWKSLEERTSGAIAPAPAASAFEPVERRDFLRLLGASMALAGAGACTRQPDERILPYAKHPEALIPGKPLYFATAMPWSGGALGLLVESHMGRPTKIEGNPDHPASLGATDAFAQAEILSLYDPARAQVVRSRGSIGTWSGLLTELVPLLEGLEASGGAGLRLLTPPVTSPTLHAQIAALLEALPNARHHQYEPVHRDFERAGAKLAFGQDVVPHVHFDKAEVVLALDADFLAEPSGVLAMRKFSEARRARRADRGGARLHVAESSVSITGAAADHRVAARPEIVAAIASAVAVKLGLDSRGPTLDAAQTAWAERAAADLLAHRGKSVVVAGREQPAEVHALAHAMNQALGNVGNTVRYFDPAALAPVDQRESLAQLAEDLRAGRVELLVTLETNPVYDAPADLQFADAYSRAKLRVALSQHEDETARLAHWHVPAAHFLESWSDARAFDGTCTIVQPLIAPLYGGKTAHELVAALAGQGMAKPYDLVKAHWQSRHEDDDFESFWQRALHDGVIANSASAARSVSCGGPAPSTEQLASASSGLACVFRADPSAFDGRYATNGWLQELPRPLTKITWDNAALLSPRTAQRLGLENGDGVELELAGARVEAPVWIAPGHADDCVTLPLGYGRTSAGPIGSNVGFDAYELRHAAECWSASGLVLRKTGSHRELAVTQTHHDMEKRDLVRVRELGAKHEAPHAQHGSTSMYPPKPYPGAAYGMVIDLNACVGCNACVVACQSENNIPIVGREEVERGREMHWIRIDRYFEGPPEDPRVLWQPLNCMHCENAPCEVVCPVGATTHSPEGLNEMTYNRCVGTRYCSNNCPYKVRRFNFLAYSDLDTESLKLGRNPDVTVRTRGVMEKCTYCVQRIQEKRIEAGRSGRAIGGNEIVTACQQVCPAQAITFGDLHDAQSDVAKLREDPSHYRLLEELNVEPRTSYLARVVESAGGERGGTR